MVGTLSWNDGTELPAATCAAVRALTKQGMSSSEIALALEIQPQTVLAHARGDCSHSHATLARVVEPVDYRDGLETERRLDALDAKRESLGIGETKLSRAIGANRAFWSTARNKGRISEEKLDEAEYVLNYYEQVGEIPATRRGD